MNTVLLYILAILILSILITLHELGHFWAGRLLGFEIVEFSVGMGPRIVKTEKNGVVYSLRALPIGGMCQFYGEDQEIKDERSFSSKTCWRRAVVLASGALMNLLTALALSVIVVSVFGVADESKLIVGVVNDASPAQAAGLAVGDRFVSVDGVTVDGYEQFSALLGAASPDGALIGVERGGEVLSLPAYDLYDAEAGRNMLGVTIGYGNKQLGVFGTIGEAFRLCGQMIAMVYQSLWMLVTGAAGLKDMAGPVGIFGVFVDAAAYGVETFLRLTIFISANLGVVNLLPLPALDGGRLVFVGVEAIRRKPIPPEKEGVVHLVGIGLLLLLIVVLTYQDIARCIGG